MKDLFRVALAGLVLLPVAAQAAVLCPLTQNDHRLDEVTMFDGPPAELASLVPEQRGRRVSWKVAYIRQAGRRGFLVCGYTKAAPKVEVEVPVAARTCSFTLNAHDQIVGPAECR